MGWAPPRFSVDDGRVLVPDAIFGASHFSDAPQDDRRCHIATKVGRLLIRTWPVSEPPEAPR